MSSEMNIADIAWDYDGKRHVGNVSDLASSTKLDFARQLIASAGGEDRWPTAWLVKWSTSETGGNNIDVYLAEEDARRAAKNVTAYARAIKVNVTPLYARPLSSDTGDGAAVDPWQPIETAPRDGTWIEAWLPKTIDDGELRTDGVITVAWSETAPGFWLGQHEMESFGNPASPEYDGPTHWRRHSEGPPAKGACR